ncbi:MAG: hypothetical protein ABJA90_04365, partial [Ginsengibacter sp.]
SERKGWDGSVKGSGKNDSEKGIQENGINKNKVVVKGWDPEKKISGDVLNNQKATVNTTRSNIKHVSRIHCTDGICVVECIAEIGGVDYDAVITGEFRQLQDSKKSVLSVIR